MTPRYTTQGEHKMSEAIPTTSDVGNEEAVAHAERFDGWLVIMLILAALLSIYLEYLDANLALSDIGGQVIIAEANQAQVTLSSRAQANQNYRIYSQFATNQALSESLNTDEALELIENDYFQILTSEWSDLDRFFLPTRYLLPDGGYDVARNQADLIVELSDRRDIDPSDDLADYRNELEASQILAVLSLMSLTSLGAFGLEQTVYPLRWRLRLFLIVGATALLFVSFGLLVHYTLQGVL
jgi:hypothetical protein